MPINPLKHPLFKDRQAFFLEHCLYDENGMIVDRRSFNNEDDADAFMSWKQQEQRDDGDYTSELYLGRCLVRMTPVGQPPEIIAGFSTNEEMTLGFLVLLEQEDLNQ